MEAAVERQVKKASGLYFSEARLQPATLEQVLKVSEGCNSQKQQLYFIETVFETFQSKVTEESFVVSVKRFLHLIHKLLGRRGAQSSFAEAISRLIVKIYTYIFRHVFKYSFNQLLLDLKVYRFRWAKKLTDEAFFDIRQQIIDNFSNFDVNRGVNEAKMTEIKAQFKQKAFTEEDMKRYFDIEPGTYEPRQSADRNDVRSHSGSPNRSYGQIGNKRIKDNFGEQPGIPQNHQAGQIHPEGYYHPHQQIAYFHPGINPILPHHYQLPGVTPYPTPGYPHGYNPQRFFYPNEASSILPIPRREVQPAAGGWNASTHNIQHLMTPALDQIVSPDHLKNSYFQSKEHGKFQTASHSPLSIGEEKWQRVEQSRQKSPIPLPIQPNLAPMLPGIILELLRSQRLECPRCGLFMATKDTYDNHIEKHIIGHLQKLGSKQNQKLNFPLLSQKEWLEAVGKDPNGRGDSFSNNNGLQVNLEIPVAGLGQTNNSWEQRLCSLCFEVVPKKWSKKSSCWVFAGVLKACVQGQERLIHLNCFDTLMSDNTR